ncbi:MAG: hypothetical protein Kow0077_10770 [Anaerolineae bacterium]
MSRIDWGEVWRSLNWEAKDRVHADEILAQRSKKYARPPEEATPSARDVLTMLIYERAGERYGIPVSHVLHGITEARSTPLPCVPPFYRGLITLRGQILTVLDLQRFWHLPVQKDPSPPRLIVITPGQLTLALQVDDIHNLADVNPAEIIPPLTAGITLPHVQGLSPDGIVILDMDSLGNDPRLRVEENIR